MGRLETAIRKHLSHGALVLILLVVATMPLYIQPYTVILLTSVFSYTTLTMSWAIFSGPTRYISLATAAFFGTGIYVSAMLGHWLPLPLVVFAGALTSLLLALLIGFLTLRLRGMYFIIFTFVAGELIRNCILWWEVNRTGTVGRWVVSVEPLTVYYGMLGIVVVTLIVSHFLRLSRYGLALRGIGESEEAADHMGVNVVGMKISAFALSAFFMGATGALMATRWSYIDPMVAFSPLYSFMPVLMAIFGGIAQLRGLIVGAVLFSLLEEVLITKFPYHYMLLFGIILIGVILFLPQGLVGLWRKGGWAKRHADP